jgi:hypothetical protein
LTLLLLALAALVAPRIWKIIQHRRLRGQEPIPGDA